MMKQPMIHTLGLYIQLLQKNNLLITSLLQPGDLSRPVALFSCDSKEVGPDTLFLCKGAHFREEYLQEAVRSGAFCFISESDYPSVTGISRILVSDVRRAMGLLADLYFNKPWQELTLIGITGTKGKSSTTYYVKYILDEYLASRGKPESGVISSIDTYDGKNRFESHLTTPESLALQKHFRNAADSGIEYLEMEVSSQGLKYDRVLGVHFGVGCFLNIGEDHISPVEHPDFEDYFASKLQIFSQSEIACVNLDSKRADEVLRAASQCRQVITFSTVDSGAVVFGSEIRKHGNDILFRVRTPRFSKEFRLTMPGLFNVQNALAAISICEALGIPERDIYVGLMKARVPGRMEIYSNADNRVISIVDYAHNKLSFEQLFASVREEYPGRRIVTVFGCPGKKAFDRRRDLGMISGRYSDLVILTEEDAGEEPVEDICREIAGWVEKEGCQYSILPDRGEAIAAAVLGCEEETVILITGKGAETRQKRGIEYIDCPSDVEYVQQYLHQYDVEHHLDGLEKVRSFLDILPAITQYQGKTILIKYGGSTLSGTTDTILEDVAALRLAGAKVVLVHGGGKSISTLLDRLQIPTRFENGYRVTDDEAMNAAEFVLSAGVNKEIVSHLARLGVPAVGISGRDGGLLRAESKSPALGRVGQIVSVDPHVIYSLLDSGYLPVISPVAADSEEYALNINADDAACAIAEALKADKLVFLTDVDGILVDSNNQQTLISSMNLTRAEEMMENGLISGGMLPKLNNCIAAIRSGVAKVVILDGRTEHALLLEGVSQKGIGTAITAQ